MIFVDPAERDPAVFFFDKEVQEYLKTLTAVDYNKVFRTRKDGHKLKPPQYKFLTNEELQEAMEKAKSKTKKYLQMPPIVKQRIEQAAVLCEDPALQDHDTSRLMIIDITTGISDKERSIVIRESDGTLKHATWQERDRMIQIYFPRSGKELYKPMMFEDKYLKVRFQLKKFV